MVERSAARLCLFKGRSLSRAVRAAKGMVVTNHPLASAAGAEMLAAGGNAVDAAIASLFTLTVVEPCSNGVGSDLFAILWTGSELVGLNASGRAPAEALTASRQSAWSASSAMNTPVSEVAIAVGP